MVTKEDVKSVRCMVQCKECKDSKRESYYLTKCKGTGKRVSRSKHIYCDCFTPKPAAKAEARKAGIKLTAIGGWIQGSDIPAGARIR